MATDATNGSPAGADGDPGSGEAYPRTTRWQTGRVRSFGDVSELMSDVIGDVLDDSLDPRKANTVVNAAGKKMKAMENQIRYERPRPARVPVAAS